jgi:hypothetical protein
MSEQVVEFLFADGIALARALFDCTCKSDGPAGRADVVRVMRAFHDG